MSKREDPRMGIEMQHSLQIPGTPNTPEWHTRHEEDITQHDQAYGNWEAWRNRQGQSQAKMQQQKEKGQSRNTTQQQHNWTCPEVPSPFPGPPPQTVGRPETLDSVVLIGNVIRRPAGQDINSQGGVWTFEGKGGIRGQNPQYLSNWYPQSNYMQQDLSKIDGPKGMPPLPLKGQGGMPAPEQQGNTRATPGTLGEQGGPWSESPPIWGTPTQWTAPAEPVIREHRKQRPYASTRREMEEIAPPVQQQEIYGTTRNKESSNDLVTQITNILLAIQEQQKGAPNQETGKTGKTRVKDPCSP